MATIKDRLKMFETNGPPIKPKPNIKLDQLSKPISTDREIKSHNADNVDANLADRSKPENEKNDEKDLTKKVHEITTEITDKIIRKSNSIDNENRTENVLKFKQKNEPIQNFKPVSDDNSSDRDSLDEFSYEFDGSIYHLPGLENFILNDDNPYQEMNESENLESVVNDVDENQSDQLIESVDSLKDESIHEIKDNNIKRSASKKLIEEIFNTSVWRHSRNYDDDYIFNPVVSSQTGIDSGGSDKFVDGQSTMSSSPSNDERRKSTSSLNQKSNKRHLFSGIFRSKRGPKKTNDKYNTNEHGYDVYDSDAAHASPDKTSLNKTTDGDTDSVDHVTKKPLNSIFNRDWLNSLGEGIKKKANVMAELRKVFSHGKPKVSKKKAQKSGTGDPVEKTIPKEDIVDDIYDDGGEDILSSEEEDIKVKKPKIKYEIKYPAKKKNCDIKPKEDIEDDIYDEDDNDINNETISDSNSVYDDGEEIDIPQCKSVKEKQEISFRKSSKSRNKNKAESFTQNNLRQSKIEDSIYDSAGDDELTEMTLEPTVSEKDKNGNDLSKSKPSSDNCSSSKKTGSEVITNAVDSDVVYTDCEEVDESLMIDETKTKKDNCTKLVPKKVTKTVSNNSSNNIGISDFKKHFFNKTKSKQKVSSDGKENSKQKEKKPEKTKDQKSKLNLNLFRKRSLRDDVYDVDYVDDEDMAEYNDNVEHRIPESSSAVSNFKDKSINDDATYDSDDIEIEEYASDPEDVNVDEPVVNNPSIQNSTTADRLLSQTKPNSIVENNRNEKKSLESNKISEIMKKNDSNLQKNKDKFIEEYQDDNNDEKNFKKTDIKNVSNLKSVIKPNNKVNDLTNQNETEIYDEDDVAESISDTEEIKPQEPKPKSIKNFNNTKQTNFPILANKGPKDKSVYHIGKVSSDIIGKQNNIISGLKFTTPNLKTPINKYNLPKINKEILDTDVYDDDDIPSGLSESQQEKSSPIEEFQMNETDDPVIQKLIKKNLQSAKKTFKLKNPIIPISLAKALKTVYSTNKNHIQLNIGELVEVILLKDGNALVKNGVGKCGWTSPANLQIIKTYEKL